LRIAYVCADPGISALGDKGASVHLRSLAGALARRGHTVTLLSTRLDGANPAPPDVTVAQLPNGELTQLLRDWRCEVVLERYSLTEEKVQESCRTLGIAHVLEVNAPLVDEAARYRGLRDLAFWRARERSVLSAADAVVAVSPAIRAHAIRCGVSPARAVVVHNGVDLEPFESVNGDSVRQRYRLGKARVVGFAGSLKAWHGVDLLLRAAVRLDPDVRILIVGDGPERSKLEVLASELRIADRVVFTGAVPYQAIPEHLAAMTVAVAPYRRQTDFYFSPLKIVEYLATGLPVVASDQGDLAHLVGKAGLMVSPDDAVELAEALGKVLGDPELRRAMHFAARRHAAGMTWDVAAAQVETALISAVAGRRSAVFNRETA
jgi:glycosyltransferase involved in cell wall biosynthesis